MYFEHVHPIFPFLDRGSFERTIGSPDLSKLLASNKAWSALYHSVLALGCQYEDGGEHIRGRERRAWALFATSLALFPDLLTLPDSLTMLQAMAAMSIFSMGISCLSIEHVIVSEGARRAQMLAKHHLTAATARPYQATFRVLYSIEKLSSFYFGRSSVRSLRSALLICPIAEREADSPCI